MKGRKLKEAIQLYSSGQPVGRHTVTFVYDKDSYGNITLLDKCPICKGTGNDWDAVDETNFPCFNCDNGYCK